MARAFEHDASNPTKDLTVSEVSPNCLSVAYTPSQHKLDASTLDDQEKNKASSAKLNLLLINSQEDTVCMYPLNYVSTKYTSNPS